jgi:hypothetical protein
MITDINEHLPTLRKYASMSEGIIEFGVREGNSTIALVAGSHSKVDSYDITPIPVELHDILKKYNFEFHLADTLNLILTHKADLLFIDTYHTRDQLFYELMNHSCMINKWIILHDTVSFGEKGEDGEVGLMYAVNAFIDLDCDWLIKETFVNNNGLLILEKKEIKK